MTIAVLDAGDVTVEPSDAVREYRLCVPSAVEAPRLARNHVAEVLGKQGWEEVAETAKLLVSEAVTNVYRHTATPRILVRTVLLDARVVVAVVDTAPEALPVWRHPDPETEHGRGMALFGLLAHAWGISWHAAAHTSAHAPGASFGEWPVPGPGEKCVWFELRWGLAA
ncbi:hypothetical protein FNQ90_06510 [Streptomyces alkaliphilus]|uniref:ATP-binding protein n=1 Tax=Streptomyces alkaliphilus TaxID=1472722 RepID=A0A7W3TBC5_9ACTN|nr:ATP-binding protein [Streptomyces alkaliphilus]MBB0243768.1 hypothetical protein [Streptomyces alkaliphilus]